MFGAHCESCRPFTCSSFFYCSYLRRAGRICCSASFISLEPSIAAGHSNDLHNALVTCSGRAFLFCMAYCSSDTLHRCGNHMRGSNPRGRAILAGLVFLSGLAGGVRILDMASGGWSSDGRDISRGCAAAPIYEETPCFFCRCGARSGNFDGSIRRAARDTYATASTGRVSVTDHRSSILSGSAWLDIVVRNGEMEEAGKYSYTAVFWRDQLRSLSGTLVILRWIRCYRI